jgi:hypothetical protein
MAEAASILRIVFILALAWAYQVRAQGLYAGDATWSNAHATFYGGSDASGTQGIIAGFDQFVSFQNAIDEAQENLALRSLELILSRSRTSCRSASYVSSVM